MKNQEFSTIEKTARLMLEQGKDAEAIKLLWENGFTQEEIDDFLYNYYS